MRTKYHNLIISKHQDTHTWAESWLCDTCSAFRREAQEQVTEQYLWIFFYKLAEDLTHSVPFTVNTEPHSIQIPSKFHSIKRILFFASTDKSDQCLLSKKGEGSGRHGNQSPRGPPNPHLVRFVPVQSPLSLCQGWFEGKAMPWEWWCLTSEASTAPSPCSSRSGNSLWVKPADRPWGHVHRPTAWSTWPPAKQPEPT